MTIEDGSRRHPTEASKHWKPGDPVPTPEELSLPLGEPDWYKAQERFRWRHQTPRGLWRMASYRFGFYRAPERLQMAVAWHAPRWLVYQCMNRAIAHATTGKLGTYHDQHVPTVLALEVFQSWNDPRGGDRWAAKWERRETKKLRRIIERWSGRRA
jgi:hypothetical protein